MIDLVIKQLIGQIVNLKHVIGPSENKFSICLEIHNLTNHIFYTDINFRHKIFYQAPYTIVDRTPKSYPINWPLSKKFCNFALLCSKFIVDAVYMYTSSHLKSSPAQTFEKCVV